MVVERGGISQSLYGGFQLVKVNQAVTVSSRRQAPPKRVAIVRDLFSDAIIALIDILP
jgi:hypothetical protein